MQEEMKFASLKNYVNDRVKSIIDSYLEREKGWVFVLVGLTDIIDPDGIKHYVDDYDTFLMNGNDNVFNDVWKRRIFGRLIDEGKDYHILSYQQYAYLTSALQSLFGAKIVFIRDNIRRLYLMNPTEYFANEDPEEEEGADALPLYQAEQLRLDENCYYMLVAPSEEFRMVDVFENELQLDYIQNDDIDNQLLDITSDKYALDIYVNECFKSGDLSKEIVIKCFQKRLNNPSNTGILRKLNYLLGLFGGKISLKQEVDVKVTDVREDIFDLLRKYWGVESFRPIKVYSDLGGDRLQNINKNIIEVSQGMLVQTIIDEYKNAKKGIVPRDLFLTAPTGAGKSLLFQLPAFYISQCGDVTIIVSPLIALMKDQVNAIKKERNFEKVAYLNSELNAIERNRVIEEVKSGQIDVVYLSPELLLSYNLSFFIGERNLGLLVIDEAHLITTWGRGFRVDYWYLGNYIRTSRKRGESKFPMVAVTATAVYDGDNDMVGDSIESLYMQNPHVFIGQVKRDDIEFVINNFEPIKKGHDKYKIQQTVDFIKGVVNYGIKTIVYVPYTKHIDEIYYSLPSEIKEAVGTYHGKLDSTWKELAYKKFKTGEKHVMLCTKAFGMGIDISDIQVVYHHAPSGLLSDYVQEIGRVARKKDLRGYALLDYSTDDQKYSKKLHGMSSIWPWQLKEMLKKIYSLYLKNGKKRKMLVSVDDFAHIFEGAEDLDSKVFTSLMMLEKDYFARHGFNVLTARPKKLYATVYAKVSNESMRLLKERYSKIRLDFTQKKNVIELDLAKLWENHFSNNSFPQMKKDFYEGSLFKKDGIIITPQVKVSYKLSLKPYEVADSLSDLFESLKRVLSDFYNTGKYFSQEDFQEKLENELNDKNKIEKIAEFVLLTYSKTEKNKSRTGNNSSTSTFLQRRPKQDGDYYEYCVNSIRYTRSFNELLQRFDRLFSLSNENTVSEYVDADNKDSTLVGYTRLGYFLELLGVGTYEMKGGNNPVIYIRLNDPERIEKDSRSMSYENQLLRNTMDKFKVNNEIFDKFFCRQLSNEERWNFIEDFFLGASNDYLEKKYKDVGNNNPNKVDLLEYLKSIEPLVKEMCSEDVGDDVSELFFPNRYVTYGQSSMLTIETSEGNVTRKISEWLTKDPIFLYEYGKKHSLKFSKEVFKIMMSKVNHQNKSYYTETQGLKVWIEFKGYPRPVPASIPYKDKPLEFYKWWCKNEDKVHLTTTEKIQLFLRVKEKNSKTLLKEHEKQLNNDK